MDRIRYQGKKVGGDQSHGSQLPIPRTQPDPTRPHRLARQPRGRNTCVCKFKSLRATSLLTAGKDFDLLLVSAFEIGFTNTNLLSVRLGTNQNMVIIVLVLPALTLTWFLGMKSSHATRICSKYLVRFGGCQQRLVLDSSPDG
jgi:hypothetical protein